MTASLQDLHGPVGKGGVVACFCGMGVVLSLFNVLLIYIDFVIVLLNFFFILWLRSSDCKGHSISFHL